jgi:hypothetical protein
VGREPLHDGGVHRGARHRVENLGVGVAAGEEDLAQDAGLVALQRNLGAGVDAGGVVVGQDVPRHDLRAGGIAEAAIPLDVDHVQEARLAVLPDAGGNGGKLGEVSVVIEAHRVVREVHPGIALGEALVVLQVCEDGIVNVPEHDLR